MRHEEKRRFDGEVGVGRSPSVATAVELPPVHAQDVAVLPGPSPSPRPAVQSPDRSAVAPRRWAWISPVVDAAFVGGASILIWVAFDLFSVSSSRSNGVLAAAAILSWVCNWPHFAATSHRLYSSPAGRRQFPLTTYVIPWIVGAGGAIALLWPEQFAATWVKVFLVWSPYHFSGQTIGVSLLYAKRAGHDVSQLERSTLSWFVLGTFLSQTTAAETGGGALTYYGIRIPSLGIWPGIPILAKAVMWAAAVGFLFTQARRRERGMALLPAICWVPLVAQFVWFILGPRAPGYYEFVPFFHALQYLFVAGAVATAGRPVAGRREVVRAVTRWWGLNVLLGVGLFVVLPWAVGVASDPLLATAVVLATVQIHHFFVDGVIWKIRKNSLDPSRLLSVRGAVTP